MHISIIIVHYNSRKDTDECLRSIARLSSTNDTYTTIVVDNASRIAYELPSGLAAERFEVVRSEANLGFTGGNNLGIYYAIEKYNSDFVLLLNNDTVVDQAFLTNLLEYAETNPQAGLVCPKIYFYKGREFHHSYTQAQKGRVLWYAGGSIDWENIIAFHRGVDEVDIGQFDRQTESEFATGCCVLVRRELLEKIGPFDKRFFLYFEDVDLSQRALLAGFSIGFCPDAIVWHKNAGSSGGAGSNLHHYYLARNRLLFAFKHGTLRHKILAVRILFQYLFSGSEYHQLAVIHFLIGRLGKQPIV